MKELERKFIIRKLPNINSDPIRYERYFLYNSEKSQIRIQKKGNCYELEKKKQVNDFLFDKQKIELTEEEFNCLKKLSSESSIIRNSYLINQKPNTTIKKYAGIFEGLIRVEIEFESEKELKEYIVPDDYIEITGTILANDNKLIKLTREQFLKELDKVFER